MRPEEINTNPLPPQTTLTIANAGEAPAQAFEDVEVGGWFIHLTYSDKLCLKISPNDAITLERHPLLFNPRSNLQVRIVPTIKITYQL